MKSGRARCRVETSETSANSSKTSISLCRLSHRPCQQFFTVVLSCRFPRSSRCVWMCCRSRFSNAVAERGLRVTCPIETRVGSHHDATAPPMLCRVCGRVSQGRISHAPLSPPSCLWSVSVRQETHRQERFFSTLGGLLSFFDVATVMTSFGRSRNPFSSVHGQYVEVFEYDACALQKSNTRLARLLVCTVQWWPLS